MKYNQLKEKLRSDKDKKIDSKSNKENKVEAVWNYFFIVCIAVSVVLIISLSFFVKDFREELRRLYVNPNYKWPEFSELSPSLLILILILAFKTTIEYMSKGLVEHCLAKKYKEPKNEAMKNLAKIYRYKLGYHIYKAIFYFGITVFGYIILKQYDYFPKTMLGDGKTVNIFAKGYPEYYFYERSPLFILYYNINLAFFLNDFIFLIKKERQSDFINMFLHHICTISLIIFSYMTNHSKVGVLVIFCHMESDILMHVMRFFLQTDHEIITVIVGILFTCNFIYMRQYVFGEIIYTLYKHLVWGFISTSLWLFLVMLYIMHLHWSSILVSRLLQILCTKSEIVDYTNYDDYIKKNKIKDNKKVE